MGVQNIDPPDNSVAFWDNAWAAEEGGDWMEGVNKSRYDFHRFATIFAWQQWARQHVLTDLEPEVLDVGCGRGHYAWFSQKRGQVIDGLDFSEVAVNHARENLLGKFILADLTDPPPVKYPVVLCQEVVEHFENPHVPIKAVYDLVAPGGYAIFSTPLANLEDGTLISTEHFCEYDDAEFVNLVMTYFSEAVNLTKGASEYGIYQVLTVKK
jgi:2-polyprenyl-3-methyl-5-hydroxy-6-metoxy-1,4-benzoquinol methylase